MCRGSQPAAEELAFTNSSWYNIAGGHHYATNLIFSITSQRA